MNIGKRIKERRIALNLTVDDLAKKLHKNRATIYRYENGDIENLPISILQPLAKSLQTTPQHLLGWERNTKNDFMDFVLASDLTDKEIEKIIDYISFLINIRRL